jgi:HAMP domain-containing protein
MKLLVKFNLIFLLVFGAGMIPAGYLSHQFLRSVAHDQVIEQARLMMQAATATRTYTVKQIKPLLQTKTEMSRRFLPQTVPAYSAVEVLGYVHEEYPRYAYREAVLNPTNPRDRTVDWEADLVTAFHNDGKRNEIIGERQTPTGLSLFFARPIRISNPACLECHSTPSAAPASMVRVYGPNNGFSWPLNEVIGAQIISVPDSLPASIAERGTTTLILYIVAIAALTLIVLNIVLYFSVIKPVAKLSAMAEGISEGNLDVPELPVRGNDEIAVLARAFNRMHRSLARAMRMLSGDEPA